ncbi:hypothetical protein HFN78_35210 [Rhizobium laguerreae]|uniref:hypothetical protein n=1 Tax=Rhizobium laguerreae TaxID=1076926 RepID=UPI001C90C731|nr:hypothetical protein [Rhizobium laguerreae]MBY3476083.1 hypothetical protein [Rhizobium laguerreae]MBY3521079.1 hypothetical protein [Rhizobium laguerreae]
MAGTNKQELVRSKRIINETFEEPRSFSAVDWRDHLALSDRIGTLDKSLSERLSTIEARVASMEGKANERSNLRIATWAASIGFIGAILGAAIGPIITQVFK